MELDEDLVEMLGEIRRLDPKPGRAFGSSGVEVLIPDVFVRAAPDGSWLTTSTVITTSATDEVGHLHDRMPMSVPVQNWSAWLDPGFGSDPRELLTVPVSGLRFHPVSTAVNKVANDGPELVEPLVE